MIYKNYDVLSVKTTKFSDLDLNDEFFNSLKEDYPGFSEWFLRKSENPAFVVKDHLGINAFLYMKLEDRDEDYSHFDQPFAPALRLKVGTFKISKNGLYLGERFFRIILEHAISNKVDEVYVTIFPKRSEQKKLIEFMDTFGFIQVTKNKNTDELVYVRKMKCIQESEPSLCNYPYINKLVERKYYMLAIDTIYHTKLIPDSILREENPNDYSSDISVANAIQKTYIGKYWIKPEPGDIIVYYRNKPPEDNRPAKYSATVTGFGIVSEHHDHVLSFDQIKAIVSNRTVLTDTEIRGKMGRNGVNILKFNDVYSFRKRPIRDFLITTGILKPIDSYRHEYPTKEITKEQFESILQEARFAKEELFI